MGTRKEMKKMMAVAALAFVTASGSHANERLYVYAPDGAEQSFALDGSRKITFTTTGMSFQAAGESATTLLFDNVSSWTFEPRGETDIAPVAASGVKVYLEAGFVMIESPVEIAAVDLYNAQGVLLQHVLPGALSADLPLSALSSGMYIVRVADRQNQTSVHKILKP